MNVLPKLYAASLMMLFFATIGFADTSSVVEAQLDIPKSKRLSDEFHERIQFTQLRLYTLETLTNSAATVEQLDVFLQADRALTKNNWQNGEILFDHFVRYFPFGSANWATAAFFWRAYCMEKLGKTKEARQAYRNVVENSISTGLPGLKREAARRLKKLDDGDMYP